MFSQSGHWTLDNLTTNDTMLEFSERLFLEREIPSFNAKDNRIMCLPHTIAVQHVLSKMSSVKALENDDDNPEELTGTADTNEDPIACVRKIVMAIQSSGQRREAFLTWIKTGNTNGLFIFQGKPVQIQPKQLLRDVRTRWDSTYEMITRCIEMRLVSPRTSFC